MWSDGNCGGGYALQGFDENGKKICAELPFGVYKYPDWIRDFLEKTPTINLSIHYLHFSAPVVFTTNEATDTNGDWHTGQAYSTQNNPKADYCYLASAD